MNHTRRQYLKGLFTLAVNDRIIPESPTANLKTPWKKPQTPRRNVPTVAEFEALVKNIREQPYSDTAQATADFVAFLGLAGVGQAEASALTWGNIDWQKNCLWIRRRKTQHLYSIPIYPHLKPLLERLVKERPRDASSQSRVFKIKDAKAALTNACKRLGYAHFSQRNIRQCLIQRLWQANVDIKCIAKWQGHQDGGKLILDTYTETFGSADDDYAQEQLDKLKSHPPVPALGFLTTKSARPVTFYEAKELQKLDHFDPYRPKRTGLLVQIGHSNRWRVEPV